MRCRQLLYIGSHRVEFVAIEKPRLSISWCEAARVERVRLLRDAVDGWLTELEATIQRPRFGKPLIELVVGDDVAVVFSIRRVHGIRSLADVLKIARAHFERSMGESAENYDFTIEASLVSNWDLIVAIPKDLMELVCGWGASMGVKIGPVRPMWVWIRDEFSEQILRERSTCLLVRTEEVNTVGILRDGSWIGTHSELAGRRNHSASNVVARAHALAPIDMSETTFVFEGQDVRGRHSGEFGSRSIALRHCAFNAADEEAR